MAPIEGFWGKPTATLDWCEENYVVSFYVAEFWNTVSNLAMILFSLVGFFYACKNTIDKCILLSFTCLMIVGIGSWSFHMTLLYEMQLFDELPMLWGSLIIIYVLVTHVYSNFFDNTSSEFLLTIALFAYGLISTVIYLSFKTPILFQIAYGLLVTLTMYFDICILKYKPCSQKLFYGAIITYYFGFGLWLIDNFYCENLRWLRKDVLPPLTNPLTQLHAWWHLMAGSGAYLHILFCAHSRSLSKKVNLAPKFNWFAGIVLDGATKVTSKKL